MKLNKIIFIKGINLRMTTRQLFIYNILLNFYNTMICQRIITIFKMVSSMLLMLTQKNFFTLMTNLRCSTHDSAISMLEDQGEKDEETNNEESEIL